MGGHSVLTVIGLQKPQRPFTEINFATGLWTNWLDKPELLRAILPMEKVSPIGLYHKIGEDSGNLGVVHHL